MPRSRTLLCGATTAVVLMLCLDAAAAADPAALRGRQLRGLTLALDVQAPVTNQVRADLLDAFMNGLENIGQHAFKLCNHGNYCGESCSGEGFSLEPWNEDLDRACRDHDWCLQETEKLGADGACVECACDERLIKVAREVGARSSDAEEVKEAPSIMLAIQLRQTLYGCTADMAQSCYQRAVELAYPNSASTSSSSSGEPTSSPSPTSSSSEEPSSSSSSSSSSCSASVLFDTDLTSGDLPDQGAVDVADWEGCCSVCSSNANCFAWTFGRREDGSGYCFQKSSSGWTEISVDTSLGVVSGRWAP